jgi:RNA polymerase-binding protein DksA
VQKTLGGVIIIVFTDVQRKAHHQRKADRQVAQKPKKASSKKTRPVRKKKNPLTKADLEYFKKLLMTKRKELLVNVNEIEDEALKKSRMNASGDLSSMPIHMADLGSDNFEQEFALGLLDSEVRLLGEIDSALERIGEGNYGICQGTAVQIRKARLEAKPWARYCVDYARKIEQGLIVKEQEEE